MRFVPDPDPALQYNAAPFEYYYSDSSESDGDEDESVLVKALIQGSNLKNKEEFGQIRVTHDDPQDRLSDVLAGLGLRERYLYAMDAFRPSEDDIDTPVVVEPIKQEAQLTEEVPEKSVEKTHESLVQPTKERIERHRKAIRDICEARERARKEAEEKRRREEEERKKREEEERKKREEEERLRKQKEKEEEEREAARKAKEEAELKKKQEEEKQKAEQAAKEREELKKAKMAAAKKEAEQRKNAYSLDSIAQEFAKYKQDIVDIKTGVVEAMNKDKDLKKIVGGHKRKINPKFGQLTHTIPQLRKITGEVIALVEETKSSELAYKWILNFMAKAIVSQSETEVTVSPGSAIPLGMLAVHLSVVFPELQYYLKARFVKKCPYIIGYSCAIDTDEGRQRMGWKRSSDGKWEVETKYNERVGGICTLFATMTRLKLDPSLAPQVQGAAHPFPISHSWRFCARILNLPLELLSNTHFAVANSWWDACAAEFLQMYGKQAKKVLELMTGAWTGSVADKRFPGAARLILQKEDWLETGTIKSFKPMEMYENA